MKARDSFVLILPLKSENEINGIIIDDKQMRYKKGIVISSGVEDIKEGVKVIYDRANAHDHIINGEKYKISRAMDVAIIL